MKYFLLGIFFASATSLSAQSAPIEDGHSIFVSSNYYEGMRLLGTSGDMGVVLGVTTQNSYGFAYDPFSDLLFSIERNSMWAPRLISVNPRTAQRTVIGGLIGVGAMAVHPVSGELYYLDEYNTSLYTVDRLSGNRTWIASTGPFGILAFHPQSHELYAARPNGSSWSLYTIDIATGQQTWLTFLNSEIYGFAFDDQGTLFALSLDYAHIGPQKLVTLDINSGLTTTICDYPPSSFPGWSVGLTFVPPLSSPSLSVSPVAPIGGQSITVSLSHAKAEADTWLTWSLVGPGAFPVPQLGITLGLAPPISHGNSRLSRLDGRVTFSGMVPPLVGTPVWMQAVQAGVISEMQTFTIQ